MKSILDKLTGLQRKLRVEIPQDKVANAFQKVYKGIQQNASIKGFRKGKAPLSAIRSLYGDRVKSDVLQDLIAEGYEYALKEHDLTPISQPSLNVDILSEEKGFNFSAEFEVRPNVELKKVENLSVEKEKLNLPDNAVDTAIENILKSRATDAPVLMDRGAQIGDVAELDFEGIIEGQALENGSAKNHKIELGSNTFIEGFEEAVVGMSPGQEREIQLSFPADYHATEIAGKPVTFKVKLHKLFQKATPELNDDFAKSLGEFQTVDELKSTVRNDIEQGESGRIKDDLKNRILKAFAKENPVDVPLSMLDQQKKTLIQDVEQRMRQQGMSDAELVEYKTKWDSDISETAKFMIQSHFLVEALANKLSLVPSKDEVKAYIADQAKSMNFEVAKLEEYYNQSTDRLNQIVYQLKEGKVVDYLTEKADVKEVAADKLKD